MLERDDNSVVASAAAASSDDGDSDGDGRVADEQEGIAAVAAAHVRRRGNVEGEMVAPVTVVATERCIWKGKSGSGYITYLYVAKLKSGTTT